MADYTISYNAKAYRTATSGEGVGGTEFILSSGRSFSEIYKESGYTQLPVYLTGFGCNLGGIKIKESGNHQVYFLF